MDKKMPPHKEAAFNEINEKYKGWSAKQQCERLLAGLSLFKINTYEASRYLGIYHPPARVLQLRKSGHDIQLDWQYITDETGDLHRVGCYILNEQLSTAYTRGKLIAALDIENDSEQ